MNSLVCVKCKEKTRFYTIAEMQEHAALTGHHEFTAGDGTVMVIG